MNERLVSRRGRDRLIYISQHVIVPKAAK